MRLLRNNRDVDSNPRGVLGSCVDAGLRGWLGLISPWCCNCGRARGGAGCQMSHPDPLARCCPAEGRAGVGFVPQTIQPGPPVSIPCLLGAGGITTDAALLGWEVVLGLEEEEEEGLRMAQVQGGRRGRAVFAPRCVFARRGRAQTRRLRHRLSRQPPDHTCTAPRGCFAALGFGTSLVLLQELHQDLPLFTPWNRGAGAPRCPSACWGHPITPSSDGESAKCCKNSGERCIGRGFQAVSKAPEIST